MQESPLITKSKEFALQIIRVCNEIKNTKKDILELCIEVKRLLISSLNTAKNNK